MPAPGETSLVLRPISFSPSPSVVVLRVLVVGIS